MALYEVIASEDGNPLPRQVEIEQENGSILLFTRQGSTSDYLTVDRVDATLSFDLQSNSWTLVRKSSEVIEFDDDGRLIALADRFGNTLAFTYTVAGIERMSGSGGRWIEFAWTGSRITGLSDSAGRTTSFVYDSAGDLTSVTAADGSVTTYEYNADHRMTALVRPGGARTENAYDSAGRLIEQVDPVERTTTFDYDRFSGTTTTAPNGTRTVHVYQEGLLIEETVAEGTLAEATTQYTYNTQGLITSVLDARGGLTTFDYDSDGNRVSRTDPLGRETTWTYGAHPSPLTVTDPAGRTTTTQYSATGLPVSSLSAEGAESLWTYNPDGTLASYTDPNGAQTLYEYDSAGRQTESVDAEARSTTVAYNPFGLPTSVVAPGGAETTTAYDAMGRILTVQDATGSQTAYTYDAAGRIATLTDGAGAVTALAYDAAGQLLNGTDPEGGVTTYTYDAAGNLASRTNPNGATWVMAYDHYGNVVSSTDPLNRETVTTYDLVGGLLSTQLPSGATTTLTRNLAGEVVSIRDALGQQTHITYNLSGQPATRTDPLGRTTSSLYDLDGRLIETEFPDGSTQEYVYDDAGNVTSFTNSDGLHTQYVFGPTGLLTSRTEPGGLTTEFEYDNAGRIDLKILPNLSEIAYTYDAEGRVLDVDFVGTSTHDIEYSYDGAGRLLTVNDITGQTTLEYDLAGRIVSEVDGSGEELVYDYDAAGQLVSLEYPDGKTATYEYDVAGNMSSVEDWLLRQFTFTWTVDGLLDEIVNPNDVTQAFDRDNAGRVTSIDVSSLTDTLAAFDYEYDAAGQISNQDWSFGTFGVQSELDHDLLGQLSGVERIGGLFSANVPIESTPGGLLTTTDDGAQLTYNPAQQVVEKAPILGDSSTFTYDANGSRVQRTVGASILQTTTYNYSPDGYLDQVSSPTGSVQYTTDARGLRQSRDAGAVENFTWSTAGGLPLLLADESDYFVYGPGSTPLAQIERSTGDPTYLHTDSLGSVRVATDESSNVLGAQSFTEYGAQLWASGSIPSAFGFTGNWTDPVTGFVHLRAREYDPQTGQFISVDPSVEDTRQPYAYAANDPTLYTDHTGLDFLNDLATNSLAFGAGVLNGATFGLSGMIMSAVVPGYECFVEANSGFYTAGDVVGTIASTAVMTAATFGAGAVVAGGLVAARLTVAAGARVTAASVRTTATTASRTASATSVRTQGSATSLQQSQTASSGAVVPYDPYQASRTLLGQLGEGYAVTPGGREVTAHAAERIVFGVARRPPTTLSRVDEILDAPDAIRYYPGSSPGSSTIRVTQRGDHVVVGGSGPERVVTVINRGG